MVMVMKKKDDFQEKFTASYIVVSCLFNVIIDQNSYEYIMQALPSQVIFIQVTIYGFTITHSFATTINMAIVERWYCWDEFKWHRWQRRSRRKCSNDTDKRWRQEGHVLRRMVSTGDRNDTKRNTENQVEREIESVGLNVDECIGHMDERNSKLFRRPKVMGKARQEVEDMMMVMKKKDEFEGKFTASYIVESFPFNC